MFSAQEYLYGWLIYVGAVLVFMLCWWRYTKMITNKETRHLLRTLAFVMMMVPWYIADDSQYLAPAWIIAGSEMIFQEPKAFWRAGTPLLIVMGAALLVSLVVELLLFFKARSATARPAE